MHNNFNSRTWEFVCVSLVLNMRLRELCKNLHGLAQQRFLRWSVGWVFKCKIQILTAFINKSHWYPTCEKSLTLYIKCSYYLFLGIRHKPQVMGRLLGLEPHSTKIFHSTSFWNVVTPYPSVHHPSIMISSSLSLYFSCELSRGSGLQNSASRLKPFVRSCAPVTLMQLSCLVSLGHLCFEHSIFIVANSGRVLWVRACVCLLVFYGEWSFALWVSTESSWAFGVWTDSRLMAHVHVERFGEVPCYFRCRSS